MSTGESRDEVVDEPLRATTGGRSAKSVTTSGVGSRASRIALAAVLLFVVLTRGGWVLHDRVTSSVTAVLHDTPSYVQPARALVHDGALNTRPGSGDPVYVRTPGYPALIAAVFVFDESENLFLLVQVLLSCLTVLVAYVLATRLWGATVGIVAAALIALEPLQFVSSGTLLTESVFSLALLGIAGLGFRVFTAGAPRPRWCLLLGIAVAAATLIRPTTYYLPVFVVVLIVVGARGSGLRKTAKGIAMFMLPVVILIGGWQVRNHFEVGSWRYSGIEGLDFYAYRGADALAHGAGITLSAARRRLDHQLSASSLATCSPAGGCSPAQPSRPGPFYDDLFGRGLSTMKSYPIETAEGAARGLARELFLPGALDVGRHLGVRSSTPLWLILETGLLCFYIAFAYGLILVIRRPNGRGLGHLFALGLAAYVLLISAGPEAFARFRGPVMPILALYAALGVTTGCRRFRGGSRRAPRHVAS